MKMTELFLKLINLTINGDKLDQKKDLVQQIRLSQEQLDSMIARVTDTIPKNISFESIVYIYILINLY